MDYVFAVMDALEIERCWLAGESNGGFTGILAVLRDPSRFHGLVTISTPAYVDRTPEREAFIAALEQQEPRRMDPHWRPQHLNLMPPLVEYDFLGRLEHFEADLERVREVTGMPVIPMQVRHARPRSECLSAGPPGLLATA